MADGEVGLSATTLERLGAQPGDLLYVADARGWLGDDIQEVRLTPADSPTANYAFDVTPRRLVTGLITERGICDADGEAVLALYPEKKK